MQRPSEPRRRRPIPTHLSTPEKIIGPFTARGLLLFLLGCTLGYLLWLRVGAWHLRLGLWALVLRVVLGGAPVMVALLLALVSVAGRSLDAWCLIALLYLPRPKRLAWRSVCLQDRFALPREALSPAGDDASEAALEEAER